MAGGFPLGLDLCNGNAFGTNAGLFTAGGTLVVPGATADTKGSWTQLVASCPTDVDFLEVTISGDSTTAARAFSHDIGIGGAGSEVILFADLIWIHPSQFTNNVYHYYLPCSIPAGTRISARSQTQDASNPGIDISIRTFQAGWQVGGSVGADTIGFNAATTKGTAITAGNGVMGSYNQIIASTTRDYSGLMMMGDNLGTGSGWLIDIGIGGAGSEQIILPGIRWDDNGAGQAVIGPYPVQIPAGSRIAIRASDCTSGGGNTFNATLYGIY